MRVRIGDAVEQIPSRFSRRSKNQRFRCDLCNTACRAFSHSWHCLLGIARGNIEKRAHHIFFDWVRCSERSSLLDWPKKTIRLFGKGRTSIRGTDTIRRISDAWQGTSKRDRSSHAAPSGRRTSDKTRGTLMIYLVTYDLHPPRNEDNIKEELKNSPGGWCNYFERTWLIGTTENLALLTQRLSRHFESTDYWLVIRFTREYWGQLPPEAWEWINSTARMVGI